MAEYCPYASNSQRDLDNCQNYVSTFPNINIMRLSLDFYWGAIRRKIFSPRKVYFLLFKGFQISKVILITRNERSGRHICSFHCLYPCFIWWVTAECVVLWWEAVPRYQQCLAWLSTLQTQARHPLSHFTSPHLPPCNQSIYWELSD